jgi:hypothetical protein
LASSREASSSFGGEAASSSKRLVDIMNASRERKWDYRTNAPPVSHAHRPVKHQTTTLQRKQVTANAASKGAARL